MTQPSVDRPTPSARSRCRHDKRGITALCSRLLELDELLVCVERPDALLIERLLDAGLHVIAVHPPRRRDAPAVQRGPGPERQRRARRAGAHGQPSLPRDVPDSASGAARL